jgi:hypothetical protein
LGTFVPDEGALMGRRMTLVVAAVLLVLMAGCGNDSADPIPTQRFSFGDTAAPQPAPGSSGPQTAGASSPASLAGLTPEQVAAAQAAVAAYQQYWATRDSIAANPGADWTSQVAMVATAGAGEDLLSMAAELAAAGQHGIGSTTVEPTVTSLNNGIVSLSVCVDTRVADVVDGAGVTVRPPDVPGSLRRFVSNAKVAVFDGGQWLVAIDDADRSTGC